MDPRDYVEYHVGSLPLILAVPHDGTLEPDCIPRRDADSYLRQIGCTESTRAERIRRFLSVVSDENTKRLAELVCNELHALSGKRPHVVVNQLHRKLMDANRDMEEAAFGNSDAEAVWKQFHDSIEKAVAAIPHRGLYVDVHGQCHDENWIELGYLLKGEQLNEGNFAPNQTSIYKLAVQKSMEDKETFPKLLYGPQSLGGLLEKQGLKVTPSPSYPSPGSGGYFNGGYNTRRYGIQSSESLDAIQIESPITERSPEKIESYAKKLAKCLYEYLQMHYKVS